MTKMSIQPLWLTYFIEILLFLEFQLTKTYFGTFSYKAHFRPQISSNDFCWDRPLGRNIVGNCSGFIYKLSQGFKLLTCLMLAVRLDQWVVKTDK